MQEHEKVTTIPFIIIFLIIFYLVFWINHNYPVDDYHYVHFAVNDGNQKVLKIATCKKIYTQKKLENRYFLDKN